MRDFVLVLDFGSQYTQLIARRVRELGVYSEIKPYFTPTDEIRRSAPKAIILSGGPASVFDEGAPTIGRELFELGIPVLGICYGMQLMAHLLGGRVERSERREFGPAELRVKQQGGIFSGVGPVLRVWMSHGDRILELPPGFVSVAESQNSPVASMRHESLPLFGTQFHPEVVHTEGGRDILANFVFAVAGCKGGWTPRSFAAQAVEDIRRRVGGGKVVCALSGGVDSAVAALIVERAVPGSLHPVFVDTGLMRKGEVQEVIGAFSSIGLRVRVVDAGDRFFGRLKGIVDPEEKRKAIGEEFIRIFEEEAGKAQGARFLVQGTLYPDVIESVSV
ncbi:MAG: glutamine-hydrolyzing GMP synthase, partial [Candidatus Methanosuratincola sp.]